MCGIAGKLWLDGSRAGDRTTVAAMTAALAHRGPDGEGLFCQGPVALGHRRLAIVDLSPLGAQPMVFDGGRLVLVVNGEFYNHLELRRDLEARGHTFRSACDSEVVGPLYDEWYEREGPAFVDRLDGMFAFALWDARAGRLVLGRDRLGQKPLVYALRDDALSFASELPALAVDGGWDRTPDDSALADYLAFRCVPHPRTAWRGASKLPPASTLVAEEGRVSVSRYWRVVPGPDDAVGLDEREAAERVREALTRSVRRRLMADVPVGALLSGGLDSAAVVGLMAREGRAPPATFTIGFDEQAYDEAPRARTVARLFGTDHHEERVRPDALQTLDAVVAHHGEPFADSSALPTFLVSRLAARHVKVVLTGDGGDESFAGYDRHRAVLLANALRRPLAAPLRLALGAAATLGTGLGAGGHRSVRQRLARFARALSVSPARANHLWRLAAGYDQLADLLTPEGSRRLGTAGPYGPDPDAPFGLNEALVLDLERYLPDDILPKVDVASMAHGLEARSPFLDRDLVELAASLPGRFKRRGRQGKRVLRAALESVLPADVMDAPKRGFGLPLDRWFRGPLLGHARDVLLSRRASERGLFRPERVAALLEAHAQGRLAAHETLYTLLILERWFLKEDGHR